MRTMTWEQLVQEILRMSHWQREQKALVGHDGALYQISGVRDVPDVDGIDWPAIETLT